MKKFAIAVTLLFVASLAFASGPPPSSSPSMGSMQNADPHQQAVAYYQSGESQPLHHSALDKRFVNARPDCKVNRQHQPGKDCALVRSRLVRAIWRPNRTAACYSLGHHIWPRCGRVLAQ